MASGKIDLFANYAQIALADAITRDITRDLKERVMAIIEPEIDAACQRAARSLKTKIETHADFALGATVVNIIQQGGTPK